MSETKETQNWLRSCDNCESQEGRHYCLLRGEPMRDMDRKTCDEWSPRRAKDDEGR